MKRQEDLIRARVATSTFEIDTVGFPSMLGPVEVGDRVIVNTTGLDLSLGTGGVGFILWNLDREELPAPGPGRIVKLRYTPWQTEVLAVESQESSQHHRLKDVESITGMPVVACSLHSQIAGVAAGIKDAHKQAVVGYLMTDGGALPLAWSELARQLQERGLVDVTATCGHAFGGDLEAINIFSGLAALRHAGGVHAAIVAMGPGIVGTGSVLGFTGMELGQALDAASALGGPGIACLRISFADDRKRHRGVSHHSLTALRLAARDRCTVAIPVLPAAESEVVAQQLEAARIPERHDLVLADGAPAVGLLERKGLSPTSMGRGMRELPELWLAAGAAGSVAASKLPA